MKSKKIVALGLTALMSLGVVACSKNNEPTTTPNQNKTEQQNTPVQNDYSQVYSTGYTNYISGLDAYSRYNNPESINEYYTKNEYPGNEKYVTELKAAYKDSRDKIQSFVDTLKKDAKTDDKKLKEMNDNLIAEGEKTIKDLDEKIKYLDNVPKDLMGKTKEEFMKAINKGTRIKDDTENGFNKMLRDINKSLGLDFNTNNNVNTNTNSTGNVDSSKSK